MKTIQLRETHHERGRYNKAASFEEKLKKRNITLSERMVFVTG
jgi:hypothetical protein